MDVMGCVHPFASCTLGFSGIIRKAAINNLTLILCGHVFISVE
jgi:hypothetical protein